MPIARIQVRKTRPREEKKALMAALHSAMQDALGTPESARQVIFVEYAPDDFEVPSGRTENFTLVEIAMFAGRSLEAKKKLYQEIVRNLGALGIEPLDVFIVLLEPPLDNWGMRGGIPASEIDLGFKVSV
jgi:phenylpyruvate tautomerase PptA (4-oxalocrotonate tautomerase family)